MAHYSIQDHARFPVEALGKACLPSGVEPSAGERESGPRRGVPLARGRAWARASRVLAAYRKPVGHRRSARQGAALGQLIPTTYDSAGPISPCTTRSAMPSRGVASRFRMTSFAPRRLAYSGKPAAG